MVKYGATSDWAALPTDRWVSGGFLAKEALSVTTLTIRFSTLGLLLLIIHSAARAQIVGTKLAVSRGSLCVTEGAVEKGPRDSMVVDVPKMRAYVNAWTSQEIEAHFTYLGPTAEQSRLGSGESRRQFGLKLRAQNACNLVYVMWRIEPESRIVVSVKRNPTENKSSECGNRGYQNLKPRHTVAVPGLRSGDSHNFSAEINGEQLRVFVDETEVWEGSIGPETRGLKGPVGIRSDNARLSFDLKAGTYVGLHPDYLLACSSGPDASE
jgi:hypothetical protein